MSEVHVSDEALAMAERLAPADGPGRAAADAEARRELLEARERAKEAKYDEIFQRGTQSALAAMMTTWLSARSACLTPPELDGRDAADLLALVRMAERLGQSLAFNSFSKS